MSLNPRITLLTKSGRILVCLFVLAIFVSVSYSQSLNELRLKPSEATGGTNLYSRNFGWSSSLVGLSGRSGLDAGIGISYNSLVWIKAAATSEIIYNPDTSNVGPGFKFGFSTIEYLYYNSLTRSALPREQQREYKRTSKAIHKTCSQTLLSMHQVGTKACQSAPKIALPPIQTYVRHKNARHGASGRRIIQA